MSRPVRRASDFHHGAQRPPNPSNLQSFETEPLYSTTLPVSETSPGISSKPKGILKNTTPSLTQGRKTRSASAPNFKIKEHISLKTEDIGHFDLNIKEPQNILINDGNVHNNEAKTTKNKAKASKKFRQKFSRSTTDNTDPSRILQESYQASLKSRIMNETMLPDDLYLKAIHAAKVESVSGISHLIVIVSSVITLAVLAKLTNDWELTIRRCPLFVETFEHVGVYWGNEQMASCHYVAYMPALLIIMSFSLIMFHGGILLSWRNGTQAYKLMLSKTYAKVLFFIELLEMAIAISILCVVMDGMRQTCLSFQLNPYTDERPENCKAGYDDRDHLFGLSGTYSKLVTGIATSIISSVMLILTSILYLIRINPCCKGKI